MRIVHNLIAFGALAGVTLLGAVADNSADGVSHPRGIPSFEEMRQRVPDMRPEEYENYREKFEEAMSGRSERGSPEADDLRPDPRKEDALRRHREEMRDRMGDSGRPGEFDREEYIRRKKEEIMNRRDKYDIPNDLDRHRDRDHYRRSRIEGLDMEPEIHSRYDHRKGRDHHHTDMKAKHSDMLQRRSSSYHQRAETAGLSEEELKTVKKHISDYTEIESRLMDYRLESKNDRLKPDGDMRKQEVKDKFKADLRKHIDSRREIEHGMRDEAQRLREAIENLLRKSAQADL